MERSHRTPEPSGLCRSGLCLPLAVRDRGPSVLLCQGHPTWTPQGSPRGARPAQAPHPHAHPPGHGVLNKLCQERARGKHEALLCCEVEWTQWCLRTCRCAALRPTGNRGSPRGFARATRQGRQMETEKARGLPPPLTGPSQELLQRSCLRTSRGTRPWGPKLEETLAQGDKWVVLGRSRPALGYRRGLHVHVCSCVVPLSGR